jgi:hypothetical protein
MAVILGRLCWEEMMNEFTKEELHCLERIKNPIFTFYEIQKAMDEQSQKFGYENHKDFLIKTGWADRFAP